MTTSYPPPAAIYVGDLNFDVTEVILFEIFKRFGNVQSIRVCRDNVTKKSLGYAYVNFTNKEDANRAIDAMNNTPIRGRTCRIMWSNRDPTERRSGVGNIFIRNLDPQIGSKELHDTFSQFGNIISVKIPIDEKHSSRKYGYVHFEQPECADKAIKIVNEKQIGDSVVYVSHFIPKSDRIKRIESIWTNVYVKNFGTEYNDDDLKQLFSPFGEITSLIIMKNQSGESRGFGFVNFKNHDDALKSLSLNDTNLPDGKKLTCCRAKKKSERALEVRKIRDSKRKNTIQSTYGRNLYVKHLEDHITEDVLRKEFEQYGKIISLRIMMDEKKQSRGFGFVCYSTELEAQRAIKEIGKSKVLPGCLKPLYVNKHEPKEQRIQRMINRGRNKNITNMPPNVYPPQGYPGVINPYIRGYPLPYVQGMPPQGMPPQGIPPQVPNPNVNPNVNPNQPTKKQQQPPQQNEEEARAALGDKVMGLITKHHPELTGNVPQKVTGMIIYSQYPVEFLNNMPEHDMKNIIDQALREVNNNY
jgi:polyadenylate-binding protein